MADAMPVADYDGAWKEAIEAYLPDCLGLLLPAIHGDIDWSQPAEFLDTELQRVAPQAEVGRRAVDKLIKVRRRNGTDAWVLLHVEVQHQQSGDFAGRMYHYYARLREHFNQPVASVGILGDEHAQWRPNRHESRLWGSTLTFEFPVVKLLDYRDRWEELATSVNPFAGVVMAHLRSLETRGDADQRRQAKVALVRWLFERGYDQQQVRQLFRFIDWLLLLPREAEHAFRVELHALEGEKTMPYITSIERLAREEGIEQGREQGIEQGIKQGKRSGLLLGLEPLLRLKFGEEGQRAFEEVRQVDDVAVLESLARQVSSANSLEEVRTLYNQPGM